MNLAKIILSEEPLFPSGECSVTRGVAALEGDGRFARELRDCLARHFSGDWGDVDAGDSALNDASVGEGSRILSAYQLCGHKIWILTEADRSRTTILFPSEY